MEDRYQKLNREQKQAVDEIYGPVMVVAGPGTGKTELLSLRVANILQKTDALPSGILCLTFTDSAKINMIKRLTGLIGQEAYKVAIHSFHSFALEIMEQNPEYFYKGARFQAVDDLTRIEILEEIFENMDHINPLSGYADGQGYVFMRDVISKIGELKKEAISPQDFSKQIQIEKEFIEQASEITKEHFLERMSIKLMPQYERLLSQLQTLNNSHPITEALNLAVSEAIDINKTKPITSWKDKYLTKNSQNLQVLKDLKNFDKYLALANFYEEYQQKLKEKGLIDFDDMIMDTISAIQTNDELKFNLQEKYQFVLVDEFQDTNGSQMKLVDLLLDSPVHEGRPNILTVGDDDQSIYKFQGANLGNILEFKEKYTNVLQVVLSANYRSNQRILDYIRTKIIKGDERLEKRYPEMSKELRAKNEKISDGEIEISSFNTQMNEFYDLAQKITKELEQTPADEIAVIAKKHKTLELAAKVLDHYGIPVNYERKKDVFEQRLVAQVITILEFLSTLNRKNEIDSDHLLPEILSYSFWGIPRMEIWNISRTAYSKGSYKDQKLWLEIMQESENPDIRNIATFLIYLAADLPELSGEEIIDYITGIKEFKADDFSFKSPYKKYYFSEEKLKNSMDEYISYLNALQFFVGSIRDYSKKEMIKVEDIIRFVQLHKKHGVKLFYTTPISTKEQAVKLVTAHSSKGLEFTNVHLISCTQNEWARGGSSKISFPSSMPIGRSKEESDDRLRLFYVAMSRAKQNLTISFHKFDDKEKEISPMEFLASDQAQHIDQEDPSKLAEILELKFGLSDFKPHQAEEKDYLKTLTEDYQLSVTHLNNFLNVADAGPLYFFEHNLLRFPEMISRPAAYGSACHDAIAALCKEYKKTEKIPDLSRFLQIFEEELRSQRLSPKDFQKALKQGADELSFYYENLIKELDPQDKIELNFRDQNVHIEGAHLSGKIDKMHINPETLEIEVTDLKTGKPLEDWNRNQGYGELKAWKYRNQLMFYKLLIENSREYSAYRMNRGLLEFIAPNQDHQFIKLSLEIHPQELEYFRKLIGIVYQKIKTLDFPDTSQYSKDKHGINAFMEDLINGEA
ncbi:ATP-dependent helicase [Patescibacteria group bacterium]|nr:ATP-dependent helicase [Patescibacteria group bacterium]